MKKLFMVLVVTMSLIMVAPAAVNAEVIEEEVIEEEIIREETPEEYEWYTDPANEDTWWAGIIRSILSVFPKREEIEIF